jgi:spore coat protein CotH
VGQFRAIAVGTLVALILAWAGPLDAQTTATSSPADPLFDNGVLQRLDLTMNPRDWEKLKANFEENTYYTVNISWRGQTMRNAWVRSRGFGSRSGTKPGLRIDFNRNASGAQEWLGLKSLILDNLKQDPSGMHEMIAFRFFERMGLPAPREAFSQLYVNTKFAGLYAVVEPVDKRYLARVFGEREEGDTENDGYLFEYKWRYPWVLTYLGRELEKYKEIFEAKTHETESISGIYDSIERMLREINDSRDDNLERNISPYLDLPLFMRHVAVQSALAEWDGLLGYAGVNNTYVYRFEKSTRSQFLVWDADNTFRAIDYPITTQHDNNTLMKLAMKVPSLRGTYFTTLLEAVRSFEEYSEEDAEADAKLKLAPRGWLEREVDRLYALIRTTMLSDTLKSFTNDEFEESIATLKQFARERGPYVRCETAKIIDPAKAPAVCAAGGS